MLTVAAELGGLAIILQLLFDAAFSLFVVLATIGLVVVVALLPVRRDRADLRLLRAC